jgi:hypothetical protein
LQFARRYLTDRCDATVRVSIWPRFRVELVPRGFRPVRSRTLRVSSGTSGGHAGAAVERASWRRLRRLPQLSAARSRRQLTRKRWTASSTCPLDGPSQAK